MKLTNPEARVAARGLELAAKAGVTRETAKLIFGSPVVMERKAKRAARANLTRCKGCFRDFVADGNLVILVQAKGKLATFEVTGPEQTRVLTLVQAVIDHKCQPGFIRTQDVHGNRWEVFVDHTARIIDRPVPPTLETDSQP